MGGLMFAPGCARAAGPAACEAPPGLEGFREFDAGLHAALSQLEARMARLTEGLALNSIFGAWEGGLPATESPEPSGPPVRLQGRIAALNVAGAFCMGGGVETDEGRMVTICAGLQAAGVIAAVVSEPKLAPGLPWPEWTGYTFHGERSAGPDSVGLLVATPGGGKALASAGSGRAPRHLVRAATGGRPWDPAVGDLRPTPSFWGCGPKAFLAATLAGVGRAAGPPKVPRLEACYPRGLQPTLCVPGHGQSTGGVLA